MKFKKLESGRSMVEMLGVLAIIGVLSVGGIAGYSLSMRRHRANGVLDAVSKYAAISYGLCQKKVMDGEATLTSSNNYTYYSGCSSYGHIDGYEGTELGQLPAGVKEIMSAHIELDPQTNNDVTIIRVEFSDQKLCQAVASIAGSSCENAGTDYYTEITIKQN